MIPTYRPKRWFGPDDYDGTGDPAYESAKRDLEIAAWDAHRAMLLSKMNWLQRAFHFLFTPSNRQPL